MSRKQYYAVWVKAKDEEGRWSHHQSLDTMSDAQDEAASCKRQGDTTLIRRQDW